MTASDNAPQNLPTLVESSLALTEARLHLLAPSETRAPVRLHKAMRHSLLSPGKRVRPVIAILSAVQFGAAPDTVVTSACAIEMVHAASLILDDLPAMDDAALRRGHPTSHVMFGDDTAILAAIGLMNLAYEVVAKDDALNPEQVGRVVQVLSTSIGSDGLIAGQEEDLHGLPEHEDVGDALALMHRRKTGALFAAAAQIGGIVADQSTDASFDLHEFGMRLGHAFQTLDDLLDALGSSETAGKDVQIDGDKPTLVALEGADGARAAAQQQLQAATDILPGGAASLLGRYAQSLAASLVARLDAA